MKEENQTEIDHAFLEELGERIRTQDGRATAEPIFMVQEKVRIFGLRSEYSDKFIYVDGDGEEVEEEDGHRTYYEDRWELVQGAVAFTEDGIKEYLRVNGHNLCEPRIYVDSLCKVPEMIRLRTILSGDRWKERESDLRGNRP